MTGSTTYPVFDGALMTGSTTYPVFDVVLMAGSTASVNSRFSLF